MPKRRNLVQFCACAVLLLAAAPAQSKEPSFQHRPLTRWLRLYEKAKPGSAAEAECRQAIRTIGTNAVPRLLQMLAGGEIDRERSALNGFAILGPLGAPAVSALTNLLAGTNPVVTVFAADSLGQIGAPALPTLLDVLTNQPYNMATLATLALADLGTNATPAIPVFIRDLGSRNHSVRERAADALGNLRLEPEIAVPALTNLLHDSSLAARCLALGSLARFQDAARPAVPAIIPLLQDAEPDVRISATNALSEIAPEQFKKTAAAFQPPTDADGHQ